MGAVEGAVDVVEGGRGDVEGGGGDVVGDVGAVEGDLGVVERGGGVEGGGDGDVGGGVVGYEILKGFGTRRKGLMWPSICAIGLDTTDTRSTALTA